MINNDLALPASVHVLLGGFLTYQAFRIKFRVDADRVEVLKGDKVSEYNVLQSGGGSSSWQSSLVTNYEFWFPCARFLSG
jgi:hypothetical protein